MCLYISYIWTLQDDEEHEVEKYLDMPPSWVDALKLSHRGMDDYFIWKCFGTVHVGMVVMSKLCVELWKLVLDGQSLWVCWFIIFFNVKYCMTVITLCTHVPADFQMRCPHGKKTKVYKRAKLEKFAHYLMKDGLISRLSVYEDRECKQKILSIYLSIIHGS